MDKSSGRDSGEYKEKVFELLGGDLMTREEWGEHYDDDEFVARDQMVSRGLDIAREFESDNITQEDVDKLLNEAERIARVAAALNRLQAYAYQAENLPNEGVLRLKQRPFVRDICDHLELDASDKKGGYAVIPTGVGKTVIFNEIIQASGLKTLVVAERNLQVKQNHDKLFEHAHGRKLDAGIFDGKNKKIGKDVTYTTYDSLLNEVRKPPHQRTINPDEYDLVILDEAHRVLGENRRTVLKYFDHAIVMGFTATDRYSDDKQLSVLLGNEITRMTLKEAESQKLVAPHHNIIVQTKTDMKDVPVTSMGDYKEDILYKSINTDERNLMVVESYVNMHWGKRTIDFCGGIQHAKDLAKMYNEHGIPAAAVWGGMKDEDHDRIFTEFREGKIWHITNAELINTGFDMDSVECVYLVQPSLSELKVMQIGGRSGRLWDEMIDKVSYIVQFIDLNYRQPPVIFAEPGVAGVARHGWDGFEFPEIVSDDNAPYTIISDPIDVEFMAMQHYEARQKKSKYPPEGWASIKDLSILSGRPLNHISTAYKQLLQAQQNIIDEYQAKGQEPEEGMILDLDFHTGVFINPETDSGRKRYFSPVMVERMAEYLEVYRLKDSVTWRRSVEIAEIYGRSQSWVKNNVLWRVRGRDDMLEYEAQMIEYPDSTKKLNHYHYEMLRAGFEENDINEDVRDIIIPPDRMRSEAKVKAEMDAKYGEGAYDIALSYTSNRGRLGWGNTAGSIAYEVDGEVVQYYTAFARRQLERMILPEGNWGIGAMGRPVRALLGPPHNLAKRGVTLAQVQEATADLLAKDESLKYYIRILYNKDTLQFEYFAEGKTMAHLYEKLVRASQSTAVAEDIAKILANAPALKKPDIEVTPIPEVAPQTKTEPKKDSKKPSAKTKKQVKTTAKQELTKLKPSFDADEARAKLDRAQELLKRYRESQT